MNNRNVNNSDKVFGNRHLVGLSIDTSADSQKNKSPYSQDSKNVFRLKGFLFSLLPLLILFLGILTSFHLAADWAMNRYLSALMPLLSSQNIATDIDDTVPSAETQQKTGLFPRIILDEEFAHLSIDSIGLTNVSVYNGDSEVQLNKGIGHFTGSRFPGQGGNVVLLGHRNMAFGAFANISIGDEVKLDASYASFTYRVVDIQVLPADDDTLLKPDDTREKLTMYTCYPFNYVGRAPSRFYVICELVTGYRFDSETGEFIPYEGVSQE